MRAARVVARGEERGGIDERDGSEGRVQIEGSDGGVVERGRRASVGVGGIGGIGGAEGGVRGDGSGQKRGRRGLGEGRRQGRER